MATSHSDGYCFLWDMRTGRALSSIAHHSDQTRTLDFSRNGNSLLTASYDGLIGVCDCRGPETTKPTASSPFQAAGATAAAPVADGTLGSSGNSVDKDPQVAVSSLAMLRAHGGRVLQACWRPTGPPAFLTSSTDCTVMLWSLPEAGMA